MKRISLFVWVSIILLTYAVPVSAQWSQYGTPVCTAVSNQEWTRTVADGEGGAIIAWKDFRSGDWNIYAQRLDAFGNPSWTSNGVTITTASGAQGELEMIPDDLGGAIIAWHDTRAGNYDVYVQRVRYNGATAWTADGVAVCTATNSQRYPRLSTDGESGAIIAWQDMRNGTTWECFVQRVDSSGTPLWTADGVSVAVLSSNKLEPIVIEDGTGGAYVLWEDDRNVNSDIYCQWFDKDGNYQLPNIGWPICTEANTQSDLRGISDGSAGFIIAWWDYRSGSDWDIYAYRMNCYGFAIWGATGTLICSGSGEPFHLDLTTDGQGGAIFVWRDDRLDPNLDIYAQRINAGGVNEWPVGGVSICSKDAEQYNPVIVSDGVGGAVITWMDNRYYGGYDLYAQRVDASGNALWTPDGILACDELYDRIDPSIASDGCNGAIVSFYDMREFTHSDIYAQRIERNGYWGYPAPQISGVRDVPGDQGGLVQVAWDASRLDIYPEDHITHYTVWRAIDEGEAVAMLAAGAYLTDYITVVTGMAFDKPIPSGNSELNSSRMLIAMWPLGSEPYYWILLETVSSSPYTDHYAVMAQTMFDSTASSSEYHYFQVIAHESDPTGFWVSRVDSGYSVDNLAPCPPLCLVGEQSFVPEGLSLTWSPNTEPDLDKYNIYRGGDLYFTPGPGNLVASPCDTTYFDGDWRWDSGYYYKVAAIDIHENESGFAVLGPDGITGGDVPEIPQAYTLYQNTPNPFNPSTMIRFDLPRASHVKLCVYNVKGELIANIVDRHMAEGRKEVVWMARDDRGWTVSSGIYFYRLTAGGFVQTKKMVLLR